MSTDFSFVYSTAKEIGASIVEVSPSKVEAVQKAVQTSFAESLLLLNGEGKKEALDVQVRAYGKNKEATPHYHAGYLCYFDGNDRFLSSQNS